MRRLTSLLDKLEDIWTAHPRGLSIVSLQRAVSAGFFVFVTAYFYHMATQISYYETVLHRPPTNMRTLAWTLFWLILTASVILTSIRVVSATQEFIMWRRAMALSLTEIEQAVNRLAFKAWANRWAVGNLWLLTAPGYTLSYDEQIELALLVTRHMTERAREARWQRYDEAVESISNLFGVALFSLLAYTLFKPLHLYHNLKARRGR